MGKKVWELSAVNIGLPQCSRLVYGEEDEGAGRWRATGEARQQGAKLVFECLFLTLPET